MSTEETKQTVRQRFEKYFTDKLLAGEKIENKMQFVALKNQSMQDLKMAPGNRGTCNEALKAVMDTMKLKVPDDVIKSSLGSGVKANLIREEVKEDTSQQQPQKPQPQQNNSTSQQPQKPNQPGEPQEQPVQRVTQEYANSITMGLQHGFRTLVTFYRKTGLIEGDEKEEQVKPQSVQAYIEETDKLAASWGDYCLRNNVNIGKYFELAILFVTTLVILGSPLLNALFFGKKKEKKKKDEVEIKDQIKEDKITI